MLVGLGGLVLLMAAVFGVLTIKFWWQIKHGQADFLQQQVYSGFTSLKTQTQGRGSDQSVGEVDRNVLENGDFPYLGNPNASTTIVVFGEFRCPYTKEVMPIIKQLVGKYGYKIKVIFRDFPAESLHPGTTKLSQIGACAYAQGKYWNASDYLFAKQTNLPVVLGAGDMADLASATGMDLNKLKQCVDSSSASIKVNRDYADGYRFGVGGTPTFFINGQKLEGVVPFEDWEKFVKEF